MKYDNCSAQANRPGLTIENRLMQLDIEQLAINRWPGRKAQRMNVYKICRAGEWRLACAGGLYSGSPDDHRDGYIHLSTASQLRGTLSRFFAGQPDLLLIALDPEQLGDELKWEPSRGGDLFPHLYRSLDTSIPLWIKPLELSGDGTHILPLEANQ